MSKIYVTTYELIGGGIDKAKTYYAETDNARQAQWDWVESIGGSGMRPSRDGGLRSVFFSGDLPPGWRRIGNAADKTEAVPNRGSKVGKAAEDALGAVPRVPQAHTLAAAVGYSPNEMAFDGERGTIYFPTELRVAFPTERFFIRLPRFERDRFTPDEAELRAIPESELMKAVEDHNAEAKRQRQKEAA